jgi:hypothetical protein
MKKTGIYIGLLLITSGMLYAQGEMDAYRFSQSDLNGTARSMSMGGAFGALGGDMSAMSHNPAGLGVYRSSEIQTTLSLTNPTTKASWTGIKYDANQAQFGFDNFSYVSYLPTGNDQGIKGFNIGIAYNKVKDFNRKYQAIGHPGSSMGNFIAAHATTAFGDKGGIYQEELSQDESYNPFDNNELYGQWLSILGYQSGFIAPQEDTRRNDVYHSAFSGLPGEATLKIWEKGSINEYNFSAATNISDRVFLGATLGMTDLDYRMSSQYDEKFGGNDYAYLANNLETEGTAYSVNLGVIIRPVDVLRLGIAYNSPKWYRMTDYFYGEGETNVSGYNPPKMEGKTPVGRYAEYKLRTPDRWIFSVAGIIGNIALVSLDYELTDYSKMYLSDRYNEGYANDNTLIRKDFGLGQRLKLGCEVKVTPRIALRAGYIRQPSPMKEHLRNGSVEVFPVGTISHYTVSNETNDYTAGVGYRFTPNFYMDLAYIYRIQSEKLYPFSNVYDMADNKNQIDPVLIEPANLSVNTSRIALTFGYKF